MRADDQNPESRQRKLLWAVFWFVFLTTPPFAAMLRRLVQHLSMDSPWVQPGVMAILGTFGGGALIAGFVFAKLNSVGRLQLFIRTVVFGTCIAFLHFMIFILIVDVWLR